MDVIVRTNLPEFQGKLDALGQKIRTRLVRAALASAGRVFKNSVKAAAPIGKARKGHSPGTLKRSVYVGRSKLTAQGATIFVSAYTGKKHQKHNRDAYYAMWVERGHVITRKALRGGEKSRAAQRGTLLGQGKKVDGKWYLKTGFRVSQNAAIDAFYDRISKGIAEGK